MPEKYDNQPIRDKVSIVLRGPDGKVKDSREIDYAAQQQKRVSTEALTTLVALLDNYKAMQEGTDDRN